MTAKKKIVLDDKPQITLSNYDIHKQLYAQMEPDQERLDKQFNKISSWFEKNIDQKYFMLLCKEISYYTVFAVKVASLAGARWRKKLEQVLKFRGTLLDLDYVERENAWECWVKNPEGEVEMYYLFPCKDFVLEV